MNQLPQILSTETTPPGRIFKAWICTKCMDAQGFKRPESVSYHGYGALCRSCNHTGYGAIIAVTVGDWLSVSIISDKDAACLAEIERLRGMG